MSDALPVVKGLIVRRLNWMVAATIAALPWGAFAETVDCAVNPGTSNNGWISDRYPIVIDPENGAVKVDDGNIQYYVKKPVDGVLTKHGEKHMAVSWRFDVGSDTGKCFRMEYRATYFRDSNRFAVYAKPPGYYETYGAQGSCTVS